MTENPYRPPQSEAIPPRPLNHLRADQIAKTLFEGLWEFHQPEHEYRVVDGREFRHLSQRFYRRTQAEFELLGFTLLGDFEDVLVNDSRLRPRTFVRAMVDPAGTTFVAFYHAKPVLWMRIAAFLFGYPLKAVEIESYTSDGGLYCTSTARESFQHPCPPYMHWEWVPRKLGLNELYQRHLGQLSAQGATGRLMRIRNVEEAIAIQDEHNRRRYEYFEEIGWATPDYLLSQGVRPDMVDEVYEEIQKLRKAARTQGEQNVEAKLEPELWWDGER